MASITVRLFASLRKYAPETFDRGTGTLDITEGSPISEIIAALDIPPDRVKMIMKNGIVASRKDPVAPNDRVALFPPELAFNLYVAMNFREDLR
ncbi:MAG: MoaD/ThiS family protein [Deltaproteobacteria bacterium]|nr:MoaD/ThiS family protein [Candidatus Zymogenaceae bacterium]